MIVLGGHDSILARVCSSSRRERARLNRYRILDAAQTRFLHDGCAATTAAQIAARADVSPRTVTQQFADGRGMVRSRATALASPVGRGSTWSSTDRQPSTRCMTSASRTTEGW